MTPSCRGDACVALSSSLSDLGAGLWTEGVPPSKRAEGAHAAEPAKATATYAQTTRTRVPGSSNTTYEPS